MLITKLSAKLYLKSTNHNLQLKTKHSQIIITAILIQAHEQCQLQQSFQAYLTRQTSC